MDFSQVRYFLALADTLNFTRAAERCYVSQPALTQGIKRLEDELGGELVRRDGRYTELTELGKSLKGHFEQINRTRHLVRATAKAIVSGDVAELNVGVMCTIGPRILTGMLDLFQMNNPMVSLVLHDVTPSAIADLLLTGGLDAVFSARHDAADSRLRYVDLYEEPMVLALPAGHALSSYDEVPVQELLKHPYVERLHCEYRPQLANLARQHSTEFDVVFSSEREDWIQSMVRDGLGISVVPRYSLLQSDLDYRPVVQPELTRTVGLAAVRDTELSPALERLIKESANYAWPSTR